MFWIETRSHKLPCWIGAPPCLFPRTFPIGLCVSGLFLCFEFLWAIPINCQSFPPPPPSPCVYNLLVFQLGSLQTCKIDTALSSEMLVPIYSNTLCHIPKFHNLSSRTIIPDYTCNEVSCRKICMNRAECQLQDKLLRIVEVLSELLMNIPFSAIHLFQLNH